MNLCVVFEIEIMGHRLCFGSTCVDIQVQSKEPKICLTHQS